MESSRDFGKMEGRVIQVNEGELKKHVSEIVRESVEDTLNSLLEAEADSLCQARRYERNGPVPGQGIIRGVCRPLPAK